MEEDFVLCALKAVSTSVEGVPETSIAGIGSHGRERSSEDASDILKTMPNRAAASRFHLVAVDALLPN
jgi:hypothetical protein